MKNAFAVMMKTENGYKAYMWSSTATLEKAIECAENIKTWERVTSVYVRDRNAKKVVYIAK